jgi:hypothetical protein
MPSLRRAGVITVFKLVCLLGRLGRHCSMRSKTILKPGRIERRRHRHPSLYLVVLGALQFHSPAFLRRPEKLTFVAAGSCSFPTRPYV